jgi:hypothetical protein
MTEVIAVGARLLRLECDEGNRGVAGGRLA